MRYLLLLIISLLSFTHFSYATGYPGKFDFYVLALSWSPDYCATQGNNDTQQCTIGKKLGLVLHGLWPQYQKGYPSNCTTEKFSKSLQEKFPNLYPSDSLYTHEWEKHGTCSGLKQADYLALSKQLKESIVIPNQYKSPTKPFRTTVTKLKQAFLATHSGWSTDFLAVSCSGSGRFLKEILFCYSLDGKATSCSQEVLKKAEKSCGKKEFLIRNIK
jgi:ribonuclease T2